MIKVVKTKKDTVHWLYGIDVKDKDIVEIPDNLLSLFLQEGYKEYKEIKSDTQENNTTQFICKYCNNEFESKGKLLAHYKSCEERK